MNRSRLAVWGDPIAHSKSPALHAAAYGVLGLDWAYDRRRVAAADFPVALGALDAEWRGLSLTMPLKDEAFRAAATRDRHAQLTGAVNTLLLGPEIAGFNTDVGGIIDALAEAGITAPRAVRILGAGATAASALVAVAEIGASSVDVRTRRPERASGLVALGERLGVPVTTGALSASVLPVSAPSASVLPVSALPVDLTIATLPSGTALDAEDAETLAEVGGVLFDAAYAPWPSALAIRWGGRPVVSGLGMLLHQAVRQIRIFRHGDPLRALPDETRVIDAMRAAVLD